MTNNNDDNVIDIGSKMDMNNFKKNGKSVISAVVIALLIIVSLLQSVYILESGKQAVILRFGKVSKVEKQSGIHFKLPYIETLRSVDTESLYTVEYGYRTIKAGTEYSEPVYDDVTQEETVIVDAANNNASLILIDLMVQYKIEDPENYLFKVDDVDGTVRLALEDVLRSTLQSFTLDNARTKKDLIDIEVKPSLQQKMDNYESGISIVTVKTQNIELLPAVQEAYTQKENANQYKKSKEEEAERYRNTIEPQYRAEITKIIEDAHSYKAETINSAKASIAQFNVIFEEYKNNKNIVQERYFIETMNDLLKNNKIIINASENEDLIKLYKVEDKINAVKTEIISEREGQ